MAAITACIEPSVACESHSSLKLNLLRNSA